MKKYGEMNKNFKISEENAVNFLEIFRSIFSLEFNKKLLDELNWTYDTFLDFMNRYDEMTEEGKNKLVEVMLYFELTFLHMMELNSNDRTLLAKSLADSEINNTSIAYLCNNILKYNNLKIENIKKLHNILMSGISCEKVNAGNFRTTDDLYVGKPKENDIIDVHYFPPLSKYIEENIELILVYLNEPELNKKVPNTYLNTDKLIFDEKNNKYLEIDKLDFDKKYALFIQPMIIQACLIIVQAFYDGNSRTARAINYACILNHTNQIFGKDYKLPLLYFSKALLGLRSDLRKHIKNIAINPSSENWCEWLIFCLKTLQTHIYSYDKNIDDINFDEKQKEYQLKKTR